MSSDERDSVGTDGTGGTDEEPSDATDTTETIDTVVVVTGSEPLHPRAVATVPDGAVVVAADGGLDHARAAGLSPVELIGDLDSVTPDGLVWAETHAHVRRHPAEKDLTDTELAVRFASSLHPETLILLAGGGDRLDHTFAAIGSLGAPELTGIPTIEVWWGDQHARVVHGPGTALLRAAVGTTLSALALHGPCAGVSMTGTRWELDDEDIGALSGRGVSNVVERSPIGIRVSLGVLTVFSEPATGTTEPGMTAPEAAEPATTGTITPEEATT